MIKNYPNVYHVLYLQWTYYLNKYEHYDMNQCEAH